MNEPPKTKTINHIRNAMLGLVVGDALGVPAEFISREYLKTRPITDMIGFGSHNQKPGTWSDDSSLALCLADELSQGFNLQKIGDSFVAWLYEKRWTPHGFVFDIGLTTREAIRRLKEGTTAHLAGNTDEDSNGNGSLMRIMPLLFYIRQNSKTIDKFEVIKDVSGITHRHIRSVLACNYYLEFANAICEGENAKDAYQLANTAFLNVTSVLNINPAEVAHFNRLLSGNMAKLKETEIYSTGYVMHTLETSVWCILTTDNFEQAVLKAVNLGEDTDTTGAVTGGLAGLLYGTEQIPAYWLGQIARLEDIEDLIQKMIAKYKDANV